MLENKVVSDIVLNVMDKLIKENKKSPVRIDLRDMPAFTLDELQNVFNVFTFFDCTVLYRGSDFFYLEAPDKGCVYGR